MKKTLIVITSEYPYRRGDPFFESEIPFLSKSFDKIYVFAVAGRLTDLATRKYPSNVKCFPLGCIFGKIKYIFKGLFSKKDFLRLKGIRGLKLASALYLLGRNQHIFESISSFLKKENTDFKNCVIYSYWLLYGIAELKLKAYLTNKGVNVLKCVSRSHGYDLYSERLPLNYQPFQENVISLLDGVFPCSQNGTEYLIKKYPSLANKIQTAYLGTNDHGLQVLNKDSKSLIFVTCSWLKPVKRLDLFAKAFSESLKEFPDLKWICIGDGPEKKKIQKILIDNGAIESCSFTGLLSNENVNILYMNNYYHCFVNVSSSEGLPVSIMEACSFGIPIIATDVGGSSEIVNSENGFLLTSSPSLADIISAIHSIVRMSKEDYLNLRISARQKWEKYFSANSNYKKWLSILMEENL